MRANQSNQNQAQAEQTFAAARKRTETLFGRLAVQNKFCSEAEVKDALAKQQLFQSRHIRKPRVGEILAARGAIKSHQIFAVLDLQTAQRDAFDEVYTRAYPSASQGSSRNDIRLADTEKLEPIQIETRIEPAINPGFATGSGQYPAAKSRRVRRSRSDRSSFAMSAVREAQRPARKKPAAPSAKADGAPVSLMVFVVVLFAITLAAFIFGDTNVQSARPEAVRPIAVSFVNPAREVKANQIAKVKPEKANYTERAMPAVQSKSEAAEAPRVIIRQPKLSDAEMARQQEMGAHLLNDARAFAHNGERDRACDLYQTIISKFGAVYGQTARKELAELTKGKMNAVPAPMMQIPEAEANSVKVEPQAENGTTEANQQAKKPMSKMDAENEADLFWWLTGKGMVQAEDAVLHRVPQWEAVSGKWNLKGTNPSAQQINGNDTLIASKSLSEFSTIKVAVRGDGDAAGISFGKGMRFLVRPTPFWQTLTIKVCDGNKIGMWVDGEARNSLEQVSGQQKLIDSVELYALARNVEFRGFTVER